MTEDSKSGMESENKSISIRENLVETAVNFLSNPSVKNKPDHGKIAFLEKKGLTALEISTAFDRLQSNPRFSTVAKHSDFEHNFNPQPKLYYPKTYSFWSNLSSISSSFIVIAVALYGLHRFYKLYIEPWLFGTKPERDEITELLKELSNSVLQLKSSVATLEESCNCQKEQVDRIFLAEGSPYMPIPIAVAELKTELANIKSILISRHQFPAVPKVVSSPTIPSWQLAGSKAKSDDYDSKTEEETVKSLSAYGTSLESDDKTERKLEDESFEDKSEFDPAESLLAVENGLNGVHDDTFNESTTSIENNE